MDVFEEKQLGETLVSWLTHKKEVWRNHYEANYDSTHKEYYRLWRAIWASEDKMRESERSKLIAPAVQQAVESSVAEIEEATFSSGKIFDIVDDSADDDTSDVALLRDKLRDDFDLARIRSNIGEVLLNAAVYGTGVAEIVLDEVTEYIPGTEELMEGDLQAVGVFEKTRPLVKLKPIQPQNFLIDPSATCIDSSEGCIIDEFVSLYSVIDLQEKGVYDSTVDVTIAAPDDNIDADSELSSQPEDRVRLTKYYGAVPVNLLTDYDDIPEDHMSSTVEGIVIMANDGEILKAMVNPYMCKDRPLVAFAWDTVPARFWGRGVVEKGYMSQKALDAELRARIDALALTTHPMMAVDSGRVPRGTKFEIRPGKMFLTSGNPAEILQPFKFGQVDQITFQQAASLQGMVQQATGAVDSAGMAQGAMSDGTLGGVAMSLGAVIKRQKRTLLNFQENFLIPFVKKAAIRYMQFDPENYPVDDYKFKVVSSLGVVAREYEIGQLSQAIQTLPAGSPAHSAVMKAIIEHLSVSNREEILGLLDEASKPNPEAQAAAQRKQQLEEAVLQGQIDLLTSQATEAQSRAAKNLMEKDLMPEELIGKYGDTNNDGELDPDFEKRMKVADFILRERETTLKEQAQANQGGQEEQLLKSLTGNMGELNSM